MKQELPERKEWTVRVVRVLARCCLALLFRLRVTGAERLPRGSAFVLLAKHQRWEDIPLLGLASPMSLYYVAKAELFRTRVAAWLLASLGGIPLNRERPLESRRFLRKMLGQLRCGRGVVIFPEGTYYRGRMGPGRVGLARMVITRSPVPVVPVGVKYTSGRWRTEVRISFGEPIDPGNEGGAEEFVGLVMKEIARLSDMPPGPPVVK
jgi:1-acyl-sn-glycerol-3-phosphate acyltransferase